MKDNELKENLVKAFQEKLKEQISTEGNIYSRGENVAIQRVINIQATLQNDLNILELLSEEGTKLNFSGNVDFSIKVENGLIDKMCNPFSVIGVIGKYLVNKDEFVFDERIIISLTNYK